MKAEKVHHDSLELSKEFTNAYKSHYHRLCAYAYQFVNDHYVAEDVVQNCFLRFWERREKIDFSFGVTSLLYLMTRQAVYEYCDKQKDLPMAQESLALLEKENYVNEMIYSETLNEIYHCSHQLPEKCAKVFTLIFKEGRDHSEAAKELKITESTLRTQKSRAITFIRQQLRKTGAFFMILLSIHLF